MRLVGEAIRFPVTTTVGVLLLVLFGIVAAIQLPVQLTPDVEEPSVMVETLWPGASPQEVEREIVDEQEEQLKSLEGLVEMESSSEQGTGQVTLKFATGTPLETALLKVANRLQQVREYPSDADKPVIRAVGADQNPMVWMSLLPAGDEPFAGDVATLLNYVDDFVKPPFERVTGVASVNVFGGREREMRVVVDPADLAANQVTITQLAAALDRENRNFSGGDFNEGKRRYLVRTVGEYSSPEQIGDVVIEVRGGVPIRVGDIATVELGYRKANARVFSKGTEVLGLNMVKETGANVLETVEGLRAVMEDVNQDVLAERGLKLILVYDETEYIYGAITLVRQSLMLGALLAIGILLVFLRSVSSTLIVAVAIPISVVGALLALFLMGRTLNVISLAGMAFAVGMVVDNSIVVLENIYRHRQMGKSAFKSALDGALEVWGAVLASTLTTVAVFVPILFVQEEAGQLFRDIAIAISAGVLLSMIVAITVIPTMANRILRVADGQGTRRGFHNLWGLTDLAQTLTERLTAALIWVCGTTARRLAVVGALLLVAVGGSWLMFPKAEYLPTGNNNWAFGILSPPAGYNIDETSKLSGVVVDRADYLWTGSAEESTELAGGGIKEFFFVAWGPLAFLGARANEPMRVRELIPELQQVIGNLPGVWGFMTQPSIFDRGIGEGRTVAVDISGPDLEKLIELGSDVFAQAPQVLEDSQVRAIPVLNLGNPELRLVTHRRRAAELGVSNRDLGYVVSALVDGVKASDYQHDGDEIDLMIMAKPSGVHRTHLLEQMPIATPDGKLVTLGSVAAPELVSGPVQIRHSERQRTVTIAVSPPRSVPLQEAMTIIEEQILAPMRADGRLTGLYSAQLSGTADKLQQTGSALKWNLLLALIITYLLMAALFENFLHPFVIMVSVPTAALGGFAGLGLMNLVTGQAHSMDVLTMLGFVILIGTVVNNAILIVHQSLNHQREDSMSTVAAVRASVKSRIRPIFMSVLTSVCGMLPLVLFPGAGSELYRGLGSVVVGGLLVSTVFTLFLVPALFLLVQDAWSALTRRTPVKVTSG